MTQEISCAQPAPDGGPAFPSHGSMGEVAQQGMALRDYFATKAMHGWMTTFCPVMFEDSDYEIAARNAYRMADAMLKARGGAA